jgi:hypothetical protein
VLQSWTRAVGIINDDPPNELFLEFISLTGPHLRVADKQEVSVRLGVDTCNLVRTVFDFDPRIAAGFADLCTRTRSRVLAKPDLYELRKWMNDFWWKFREDYVPAEPLADLCAAPRLPSVRGGL